jgi:hypothetical protein
MFKQTTELASDPEVAGIRGDLALTLERLAHNAALEARLRREGAPNASAAIAATRRVSELLVREAGFGIRLDDRGDRWVTANGVDIVFLGNAEDQVT